MTKLPNLGARQLFWERAAVGALTVILEDNDATPTEAAEMATECADLLLNAWKERFEPRKAI